MPSEDNRRPVARRLARGLRTHPLSAVRAVTLLLRSQELKRLVWLSWERAIDGSQSDRAHRYYAYEALGRLVDGIKFQRDGFTWHVMVDGNVSKGLFIEGGFQGAEIDAVLKWLAAHRPSASPANTVVDVGANFGTTTIPIARAGYRVVAIEPTPAAFELLTKNVAANRCEDQVLALNIGVGTADGSSHIAVPDGDTGRAEIVTDTGRRGAHAKEWKIFEVQVEPLADSLARRGIEPRDLRLVWSDTQGSEAVVIESGAALWTTGVPLFVEVWPEGLAAHGGRERFLELIGETYGSFLPSSDLLRQGVQAAEHPIAGFREWFLSFERDAARQQADESSAAYSLVSSPTPGSYPFTDVLLLPPRRSRAS